MLEDANGNGKVSREEYEARERQLRVDLLNTQFDLQAADFSVMLLIAGDDRLGVNELIRLIHEWMDGRYLQTWIFSAPTAEEQERPRAWRYWRVMPPRGRIAVYAGGWGQPAIGERVRGLLSEESFECRLKSIKHFERTVAADGTLVLKYWLHLPRKHLKRRMVRAALDQSSSWQLEEADWQTYEFYDESLPYIERLLQKTSTSACRWRVLPGHNRRYRNLCFAETFLEEVNKRLNGARPPLKIPAPDTIKCVDALAKVDLSRRLEKKTYRQRLEEQQARLAKLTRLARRVGQSSVIVFEGWDAAGKGGAIRRITRAMSVRDYRVAPVGAPTEEELARHYLWRFWRRLPRAGKMLIFDRSWYGRVLVERVEKLASTAEWRRAYDEINAFEEEIIDRGIVICKFWLHIDAEEQLARFEAREKTPYKKYKLTDEDYRNRERWDDYVAAVNEMVARTSRDNAPWHLVPSNNKRYARVNVLQTVCDAFEKTLGIG
jgi:polyphosphate:AMP phosphotransferase